MLENSSSPIHMNLSSRQSDATLIEDIFSPHTGIIYAIISSTILCLGIIGNLVLIHVYYRGRIQRTHFHFCLVHLGIANICQQIGFVPWLVVDLKRVYSQLAILDSIICGFTDGLSGFFVSAFVSVFIICHMSIVRYRIIKRPMTMVGIHKRRSKRIFFCFWAASILLITPNLLTFENTRIYGFCLRTHRYTREFTGIYRSSMSLIGLVIPVLIMTVIYFLIVCQFYSVTTKAGPDFVSQVKINHRYRVVRFLGMLVFTFWCSWLPFGIYFILNTIGFFEDNITTEYLKTRIMKWTMLPCLSTAVTNVLVYTIMNPQFRREFWNRHRKKRRTAAIASAILNRHYLDTTVISDARRNSNISIYSETNVRCESSLVVTSNDLCSC